MSCYDIAMLSVAILSLACDFLMIYIMIYELKPEIAKLQQKFDTSLERAKVELIYKRYFEGKGEPENFADLVRAAYSDLMKLIPEPNDHYLLEDWLLAGWLIKERDYDTRVEIEPKERQRRLAHEIYEIRKNLK